MKKNIILIAAALFLFLGNSSVIAQAKMKKDVQSIDTEKVEAEAEKKTKSLVRALGLSDEQQKQVYYLFTKAGKKMQAANVSAGSDGKEMKAKNTKMNAYIKEKMKEILKEEQYAKYLELADSL